MEHFNGILTSDSKLHCQFLGFKYSKQKEMHEFTSTLALISVYFQGDNLKKKKNDVDQLFLKMLAF